ncbi:hypothetical protein SLA2020_134670 [Shorea laevis]
MASQNPNQKPSLYPDVIQSNPISPNQPSSPGNLYPTIDMRDLVENLFPESPVSVGNHHNTYPDVSAPSAPPVATEEVLIKIPGAILHLIDKSISVELGCGDLTVLRLFQGQNLVAVIARVGDAIQWPLTKDGAAVKLDECHYFFSLRFPKESDSSSDEDEDDQSEKKPGSGSISDLNMINYGLTIVSKGQEALVRELDGILQSYSCFSIQKVREKGEEVLDGAVAAARDTSPTDLKSGKTKEVMEERCAAYWTTLAPNVEDYSGTAAKVIAAGSGHLIKGILWCGDVTVERLKWGNKVLKKRMTPGETAEISPETLKRIRRVKKITKRTEKVANGVLSGFVKVSGIFSSKLANSKAGKKFFGLLPGEMILATLDGFDKACDAVEVAGKNVMATSSTVTTDLVAHRYGDKVAEATSEGLDAAGHAIGTAWAASKLRKALNPKSVLKPSKLAKAAVKAAAEHKAKSSK